MSDDIVEDADVNCNVTICQLRLQRDHFVLFKEIKIKIGLSIFGIKTIGRIKQCDDVCLGSRKLCLIICRRHNRTWY